MEAAIAGVMLSLDVEPPTADPTTSDKTEADPATPEATEADPSIRPMRGKCSTQLDPFRQHPVKDTASHGTTLLPLG